MQCNMQMPINNNTWPQPKRPETKPSIAPTRSTRPTQSGFTSINGPTLKPVGVVKPSQPGKTPALRLPYDDHRAQAVLAAAAQNLSGLKTASGKNHAQTTDALERITKYCEAVSRKTETIMQNIYAIANEVHNNGEKQCVIGTDIRAILEVIQAAQEQNQAAQEKNQSNIRELQEVVRNMPKGEQRHFDEPKGQLEETMRVLQRAPTLQIQTEHAEDTNSVEEDSKIVVQASKKKRMPLRRVLRYRAEATSSRTLRPREK